MLKRKIFWTGLTVLGIIIVASVIGVNVISSMERLVPMSCGDIDEEWIHSKTNYTSIRNFLHAYPDANLENKGNDEQFPRYCVYVLSDPTHEDSKEMIIKIDKHKKIHSIKSTGFHPSTLIN